MSFLPPVDNSKPINLVDSPAKAQKRSSSSTHIDSEICKRLTMMERNQEQLGTTLKDLVCAISSGRHNHSSSAPYLTHSLFNTPSSSPSSSPEIEMAREFGSFLSSESKEENRQRFLSRWGVSYPYRGGF